MVSSAPRTFALVLAAGVAGFAAAWWLKPPTEPPPPATSLANARPADRAGEPAATRSEETPAASEGARDERAAVAESAEAAAAREAALVAERDAAQRAAGMARLERDYLRLHQEHARQAAERPPLALADAALLIGRLPAQADEFMVRWGQGAPPEGDPLFEEYQRELDALTDGIAQIERTFSEDDSELVRAIARSPEGVSEFRSLQIRGALALDNATWRRADTTLRVAYTEAFRQGLNWGARPDDPAARAAWEAGRRELARRTLAQVEATLPPEKRAEFRTRFDEEQFWMVNARPPRLW